MLSYWLAKPATREQIASRLRTQGVKALVTAGTPLVPANWRSIGDTGYFIQLLNGPLSAGFREVSKQGAGPFVNKP